MASRRIEDLHPEMQVRAMACQSDWEGAGLDVLITCTWRSGAEQNELYAQGRTKPGRIVTRARAGESAHNFTINGKPASLAFDIVPLRLGKAIWGTSGNGIDQNPSDDDTDDLELWQRVAVVAKLHALTWYGDPGQPFREFPHFQMPNAREIMMSGAS